MASFQDDLDKTKCPPILSSAADNEIMEVEVLRTITLKRANQAPLRSSPPAYQYSVFYRPDALPAFYPTVSKHQRQHYITQKYKKSCPKI